MALLAGCNGAQDYVDTFAAPAPAVHQLRICHGYGCRWMTNVRIEPVAQEELARLFQPAPRDAAEERVRLGRAVALFEIKVGAAIGTGNDRYAATTLIVLGAGRKIELRFRPSLALSRGGAGRDLRSHRVRYLDLCAFALLKAAIDGDGHAVGEGCR